MMRALVWGILGTLATAATSVAAPTTTASGMPYPPVPPWEGEPPALVSLPSPCPGPDCPIALPAESSPQSLGRRTVYLNFDGVTLTSSQFSDDAVSNESAIVSRNMSIPSFEVGALGFTGDLSREEIIQYSVDQMRATFATYDVEFTTTRPTSGSYHMIVFAGEGSTCENTAGANCAGIALRDCGDFLPSNIVFVFTWGLRYADLAQVASHEGGHAFGLDHIDNTDAIMFWSVQNHVTTNFTEGPTITSDACNSDTYQDSRERLMDNIGPRGQDVLAPQVQIVTPVNGSTVVVGSPVIATVDDIDSEVAGLRLLVNGDEIATATNPPWEFSVPTSVPLGAATLRLEATDTGGNTSASSVAVEIAGDIPCESDEGCPTGLRCGSDDICVPDAIDGVLGAPCTVNEDCVTGLCGTVEGESRCTQSCDQVTPCPGGFSCLDDVACWPADGGGGGGCTIGGDGGLSGLLLLVGFGLFASGRRRRS